MCVSGELIYDAWTLSGKALKMAETHLTILADREREPRWLNNKVWIFFFSPNDAALDVWFYQYSWLILRSTKRRRESRGAPAGFTEAEGLLQLRGERERGAEIALHRHMKMLSRKSGNFPNGSDFLISHSFSLSHSFLPSTHPPSLCLSLHLSVSFPLLFSDLHH